MKEEYRELINKCRPRLIEAISRSGCLDELINHLGWQDPNGDNGLISDNIIQIKEGNHANDDAKAGTFLDILTTRGEDIFDHFINAIHATNQTGLIEILVSELLPNQRIQNERSTSAASASAHASSSVYIFNNQDNKGRMVGGPVHGGFVNLGDNNQFLFHTHPAPSSSFQPSIEDWKKTLYNIQSSLRRIYSKSYRNVIPFSLPFFFDIEEKWVNLTLKLETESTDTTDCITWFNEEFAKADMLIIEGDPGIGKSSFMHRLAYEWTQEQSRLSDYDLVLLIEFRKLREYTFKNFEDLIIHYMKSNPLNVDEEDYKVFHHFINDSKHCEEHKILVLLDGYDESALEEQCQELSDFISSPISRPLRFNVLMTSRKGYLSNLRSQGRFIFAEIIGFTTELQREEYITRHFNVENGTESSENTAAVTSLLNTNPNLKRLAESPLMLTFICLLHKNISDGTEVELYMNIIWWMIDRYQKSNPSKDVPSLFGFEYDATDKFRIIENNYQHFPQLHQLGRMAMQDIYKTTFTETDLKKIQLNEIVQQVGFLRKEETRDSSYHTKTEFSFVHRTVQEFIMALTFFFSIEVLPEIFIDYVFLTAANKGYGIIPAKIQTFVNMIYSSKIEIEEGRKNVYSRCIKLFKDVSLNSFPQLEYHYLSAIHSQDDAMGLINSKQRRIPKSSEEAIKLLHDEAEKGDVLAQCNLGIMYEHGIVTSQSDEEAVIWYSQSAEQGHAVAQNNLGYMYKDGRGVPQSDEEAVKWFRKSAEQGDAVAQSNLGSMYDDGKGVPQSNEEAVKWYRKSAEQGHAVAQNDLGFMYWNGRGVPQSDEEAVRLFRISAEQGNASGQFNLGWMYEKGRGVPQSYEEAFKWRKKSAKRGDARAQSILGWMYQYGQGVPQSDEKAVKWYRKSAEQGDGDAQFHLGWMYRNGRGVNQSDEEADKWYTKSSKQGNGGAQLHLALLPIQSYCRRLISIVSWR